jgi:hypothetical protein
MELVIEDDQVVDVVVGAPPLVNVSVVESVVAAVTVAGPPGPPGPPGSPGTSVVFTDNGDSTWTVVL